MKPASSLFFILYFFEGAPIGLVWWTIPTLMASHGSTVDVITALTAAAALPWTFKFLLGPVVDRYFFTIRGYALAVAAFQALMLLCLVGLLLTSISAPAFFWLTLAVSAFSAMQDVFIDAWAIGATPEDQRGTINGAMQAGLLTGRWVFGAGLLIALAYLSWAVAVSVLCVLLFGSIVYLCRTYRNNQSPISPAEHRLSLQSFNFVWSRKFLVLALIAVLSGFAFESFGSVVGPFLIANGYDKSQVGFVLSGTLVAMLIGAVLGGRVADNKGHKFIFVGAGLALSVLVSLVGFLHLSALSWLLIALTCLTYFFIGTFTAASYSFYMGQAKGPMVATRFTFLMAMTNLSESVAAFSVGRVIVASSFTYTAGFLFAAVVSLFGIGILWRYRTRV